MIFGCPPWNSDLFATDVEYRRQRTQADVRWINWLRALALIDSLQYGEARKRITERYLSAVRGAK